MKHTLPNSALYWLPRIEKAGLPVPQTEIVPFSTEGVYPIFDGERSDEFDRLVEAVRVAAERIGKPVFVRTDQTSAKHGGPSHYLITDNESVGDVLANTIADHELKLMFGPYAEAILVRQFLKLRHSFCAFGGLPISREFRFFANARQVICIHPYWPEEAMVFYGGEPTGWREQLAAMHRIPDEIEGLKDLAMRAAGACGDSDWSVDFCQDENGDWWLLDMALAGCSWHWPACPFGQHNEHK